MRFSELMRRDWNERAQKDAFYYVATWRNDWDSGSFFRSGEQDYEEFVGPVLARLQFQPQGRVMVEIGCGAGRMTKSFARRFEKVYAVDVSEAMLQRGQDLLKEISNVVWIRGDGLALSDIAKNSVDFVFSYLVLQHLPEEQLVLNYVREMIRVLKKDGVFLFQFNSSRGPTMNWKGQLIWGIVNNLWTLHLNQASKSIATLLRLDPHMVGRTWHGPVVEINRVLEAIRAAGGSVSAVTGGGTLRTWCFGKRLRS